MNVSVGDRVLLEHHHVKLVQILRHIDFFDVGYIFLLEELLGLLTVLIHVLIEAPLIFRAENIGVQNFQVFTFRPRVDSGVPKVLLVQIR